MVRVTRLREPQPTLNRRSRRTRPSSDDRIPIQNLDKSFGIMQISRLKPFEFIVFDRIDVRRERKEGAQHGGNADNPKHCSDTVALAVQG